MINAIPQARTDCVCALIGEQGRGNVLFGRRITLWDEGRRISAELLIPRLIFRRDLAEKEGSAVLLFIDAIWILESGAVPSSTICYWL